jgi:diphthine-ammonia ligase
VTAAPGFLEPGTSFFCSWSGGKDCCLAFQLSVEAGARPAALFTIMDETGARSHSHGLSLASLQVQADALGLPLVVRNASWAAYEDAFLDGLAELRRMGIVDGVFGDMTVASHPEWVAHRTWVERVALTAGVKVHLPLWDMGGEVVLVSQLQHHIHAVIVATRDTAVSQAFLGRTLDEACIEELRTAGCDPTGEGGELHTVVTGMPLFAFAPRVTVGAVTAHEGCHFVEVRLERP